MSFEARWFRWFEASRERGVHTGRDRVCVTGRVYADR